MKTLLGLLEFLSPGQFLSSMTIVLVLGLLFLFRTKRCPELTEVQVERAIKVDTTKVKVLQNIENALKKSGLNLVDIKLCFPRMDEPELSFRNCSSLSESVYQVIREMLDENDFSLDELELYHDERLVMIPFKVPKLGRFVLDLVSAEWEGETSHVITVSEDFEG